MKVVKALLVYAFSVRVDTKAQIVMHSVQLTVKVTFVVDRTEAVVLVTTDTTDPLVCA